MQWIRSFCLNRQMRVSIRPAHGRNQGKASPQRHRHASRQYDIHSSGHAYQEELKLMLRLFNPEYFAPYHGEYRMLKTHTDLAYECGIPKSKNFILNNGDILNISKEGIKKQGHVQAGEVYVDGSRIGDVSNVVLKDRTLMSNNGVLAIIINIAFNFKSFAQLFKKLKNKISKGK